MSAIDTEQAERLAPAEASELPVSDKPVTLSFKGVLGSNKAVTGTTGAFQL